VASKAQTGDQVVIRFNRFSFAATPIYVRRAHRSIFRAAMLASYCSASL
jgi:hypothetical protein